MVWENYSGKFGSLGYIDYKLMANYLPDYVFDREYDFYRFFESSAISSYCIEVLLDCELPVEVKMYGYTGADTPSASLICHSSIQVASARMDPVYTDLLFPVGELRASTKNWAIYASLEWGCTTLLAYNNCCSRYAEKILDTYRGSVRDIDFMSVIIADSLDLNDVSSQIFSENLIRSYVDKK